MICSMGYNHSTLSSIWLTAPTSSQRSDRPLVLLHVTPAHYTTNCCYQSAERALDDPTRMGPAMCSAEVSDINRIHCNAQQHTITQ